MNIKKEILGAAQRKSWGELPSLLRNPSLKCSHDDPLINEVFVRCSTSGSLELLELLLEIGANIDYAFKGWTALVSSSVSADIELVRFLLARKANVNIKAQGGETALQKVINFGGHSQYFDLRSDYMAISTMLIEAGVEIDALDDCGNSSLDLAFRYHWVEMARLLVASGASVRSEIGGGKQLLLNAVEEDSRQLMELVFQLRSVADAPSWLDGAALAEATWNAAIKGRTQVVEMLIAQGASSRLQDGRDALSVCASVRHEFVQFLDAIGESEV